MLDQLWAILGNLWVDLVTILVQFGVMLDRLETILEAVDMKTQGHQLGYPFFEVNKTPSRGEKH